jgi:hypothetical protein
LTVNVNTLPWFLGAQRQWVLYGLIVGTVWFDSKLVQQPIGTNPTKETEYGGNKEQLSQVHLTYLGTKCNGQNHTMTTLLD